MLREMAIAVGCIGMMGVLMFIIQWSKPRKKDRSPQPNWIEHYNRKGD